MVPSNQGKTLTFAFPLNQCRRRKSPPLKGNLFDVWMSECVRRLPKHIHAFTALDTGWVSCLDPGGKLKVTFSLHVGCFGSQALLQSGLDGQREGERLIDHALFFLFWPCCTVHLHNALVRPNILWDGLLTSNAMVYFGGVWCILLFVVSFLLYVSSMHRGSLVVQQSFKALG